MRFDWLKDYQSSQPSSSLVTELRDCELDWFLVRREFRLVSALFVGGSCSIRWLVSLERKHKMVSLRRKKERNTIQFCPRKCKEQLRRGLHIKTKKCKLIIMVTFVFCNRTGGGHLAAVLQCYWSLHSFLTWQWSCFPQCFPRNLYQPSK